jgi:hypothetical protein
VRHQFIILVCRIKKPSELYLLLAVEAMDRMGFFFSPGERWEEQPGENRYYRYDNQKFD